MKFRISPLVLILLAVLVFSACTGATSGVLTTKETAQLENLYGQDRDAVFRELGIKEQDVETALNENTYLSLAKTRTIGNLRYQRRLAFNLPSAFAGEDLVYVGEPGSASDPEVLKGLKALYDGAVKQYGEPDNDPDVVRTHLSELLEEQPQKIRQSYDSWNLSDKTVLTLSVMEVEDRALIEVQYRQAVK